MQRTVYSPFKVIFKAVGLLAVNAHCIACSEWTGSGNDWCNSNDL